MKYKDIILTASSNMFRSKLRTILTILAIFVGAFTLTLTNGLGAGISSYVDRQVSNLGQEDVIMITAKNPSADGLESDAPQKYDPSKQTGASLEGPPGSTAVLLTNTDIDKLKTYSEITDVYPMFSVGPDYIEGVNAQKYRLTVAMTEASAHLDLAAGKQLSVNGSENQIILPVSYIEPLGYANPQTAIGKTANIAISDATGVQHSVRAKIVGVLQKGLLGSAGSVINNTLKDNLYELQNIGLPAAATGKYQIATAKIAGDLSDTHIQTIKDKLGGMGYDVRTTADQLGIFKTVINTITYVLNAFAIIALLAASFGIVNTLLMAVQERTKEIGLMKAMGMRSSRIFALFSFEAILIGVWGSVLGVGAAVMLGLLANKLASDSILKDLPGFNLLAFPLSSIMFVILLIVTIAFLAGTLPARKASKQNPIDALRYE
jgi:putative ABC transport system permease protein